MRLEKYLEYRWGFNARYGDRLIKSAEFMQLMTTEPHAKNVSKFITFGDISEPVLPKSEGQIRPLLENLKHNGERLKVWGDVRRVAPVSAAKSLEFRRYQDLL